MLLSLPKDELQSYTSAQLNYFFPDKDTVKLANYSNIVNLALDRIDFCFGKTSHSRYNNSGQTILNHLYTDQYLMFVWFLANTFWKEKGKNIISEKLYCLNKALHAFDCMYDTGLPDIFLIFHAAGTMLGKAKYDDYFVALQGCTIGSHKGKYPVMGKGVSLTAHTAIIGNCTVGNRVSLSAYTSVFEKDIPDDTVVSADKETGQKSFRYSKNPYAQQFFNVDLMNA